MADFGLDNLARRANVTTSLRGWRDRIEALIESFLGANNPFGNASTLETGTSAGNSIKTDENGNIPSSLSTVSGGTGVTTFITKIEERGYNKYADNVEYVETYDAATRTMTCIFKVSKKGSTPEPTVISPVPKTNITLAGIPTVLGVGFEQTETFSINTGAELDSLVFSVPDDRTNVSTITITGSGRNWTVNVRGNVADTYAPITFTATAGDEVVTKFMRVQVRQAIVPNVIPKIVGLQDNHTLSPGESVRDNWTVTPPTAIVNIDESPDPGFVSYSSGPDRTGVTWTAVAPADNGTGSRRALISVQNGTLFTRYYVSFEVIGSTSDDNDAGGGIIA